MRVFVALLIASFSAPAFAADTPPPPSTDIQQVLAHPLFDQMYVCSEHAVGQLPYPGDDLGQDCMIMSFDESDPAVFYKLYRTDGATNEDWYGWNRPVRSPCDCEVVDVTANEATNQPGRPHRSPAAGLVLKSGDGTMFALGHLQGIVVAKGAKLKRGDRVGFVGNNGYARAPHVHIGAWRGDQALQIRWDQRAIPVE
jgi:hypothetical protein